MESDIAYLRRRLDQEQALAASASLDCARVIHEALADAYRARIAASQTIKVNVLANAIKQVRHVIRQTVP